MLMLPSFRSFRRQVVLLALPALLAVACHKTEPDPAPVTPEAFSPPTPADAVFYEVNLRALGPTHDLAALRGQLDSIKSLGANVLWLMPPYPVGVARAVPPLGSPYSVRDYQAINPEFGTLADFQSLVEAAHQRGLAVVLDWVANHTAWDHPWIAAHPEWYTHDAAGNITIPAGTNWQDVADLDFTAQPMRAEMIKAMKYWVTTANVDGFRCDAADMVPANFWKQALDTLKAIPDHPLLLLAEGARVDHYTAGFQLTYGWDFYTQLKRVFRDGQAAASLPTVHNQETAALPSGARKLRFTTNHDETCWDNPPVAIFGGTAGALAASVATICLGGTPLLYNGQEVGCPLKLPLFDRSTITWTANPEMRAAYRRLLRGYNALPALRTGTLTSYPDPDILCFVRGTGAKEVLVLVNVRDHPVTWTVPGALVGTAWRSALTMGAPPSTFSSTFTLEPYKWWVLRQ